MYANLLMIAYFLAENNYYGWNAVPKSDSEMIADCLGLAAMAIILAMRENKTLTRAL